MAELVVVTGAGVNLDLADYDGRHPPGALDVFQQYGPTAPWQDPVFEYIEKYWGLSRDDLSREDFDLEECLTLIQLQHREAHGEGRAALKRVELLLVGLLSEFLSLFKPREDEHYRAYEEFARLIWDCEATVITFNYDSLLEGVIEKCSGDKIPLTEWQEYLGDTKDSDEAFLQMEKKWHKPLCYGFQFDYVEIPLELGQTGITRLVPKEEYYTGTRSALRSPPFLKMHGSLDWFRHSGKWSEHASAMWKHRSKKSPVREFFDRILRPRRLVEVTRSPTLVQSLCDIRHLG